MAAAYVHVPLAAVSHRFEVSVLLFGGLLVIGALSSGLAQRSFALPDRRIVLAGWIASGTRISTSPS